MPGCFSNLGLINAYFVWIKSKLTRQRFDNFLSFLFDLALWNTFEPKETLKVSPVEHSYVIKKVTCQGPLICSVWQQKWHSNFISPNTWKSVWTQTLQKTLPSLRWDSLDKNPSTSLFHHLFFKTQKSSRVTNMTGCLKGTRSHPTFGWRLKGWDDSLGPQHLSKHKSTGWNLQK